MTDELPKTDENVPFDDVAAGSAHSRRTEPSGASPASEALREVLGNTGLAKRVVDAQRAALGSVGFTEAVTRAMGGTTMAKRLAHAQRTANAAYAIPDPVKLLGMKPVQIAETQQRLLLQAIPATSAAASVLDDILKSQKSMVERAMKPVLDSQTMWGEQLAAQRQIILSSLAPALSTLGSLRRALFPPNLRSLEDQDMSVVDDIVLNEGIAMYGVPRTEIVVALVRAVDVESRRAVIDDRRDDILDDCRAATGRFGTEAGRPYARHLLAAIDAIASGHAEAGQALVGSIIDAALTSLFEDGMGAELKPKGDDRKPAVYDDLGTRDLLAFAPIWQTYQHYFAKRKDPVPNTFNRHATAHTVSDLQYNGTNAVQGALIACALLLRCNEALELKVEAA
ncbi:hypothetical protein L5G28_08525 [Gordonia sp. HY285]|uniref:hypothetical protein n=1 Tax=Gordonia liuliyuniae TaxID=2911517 RepID=UPI001F1AE500|nr:hypothetical protein [Gordonia liuliyuniae]MCF8610202.1 hypothetical protein [Gordonia liuliyuniae]